MSALTYSDAYDLISQQGADVVIPSNYTSIEEGAFSGADLRSVVIPDSITEIGDSAFQNNQLTSVIIPWSVVNIGIDALQQ